ncbi:HD family phosphohydrolase [Natranaerobius thermophilus]|uniref:Metal dependent phosphohydrolase n=1 Tax=Natranaerobius thermophilus (strain ATCC BAA-1301 / DSM 18059 / JW/NM-WN-LF) TaxID=457570 RepID=B2A1X7_NATTJ|nr:HDIG domain-containing metalloprotein [Natranaerobius thermophilus]ACB84782.1 metal dependent phosphohydrolase [Natranaerobius thermophilus JW/NM-WN-LF]
MFFKKGAQSKTTNQNQRGISPLWQRVIIALLVFLSVFGVMSIGFLPDTLEVGQVSPKNYYAPREVEDSYTTEQRRQEAAKEVPEVYDLDPSVKEKSLDTIDEVYDIMITFNREMNDAMEEASQGENNHEGWNEEEYRQELIAEFNEEVPLDLEELEIPLGYVETDDLKNIQEDAKTILVGFMDQGVKPDGIENVQEQIEQRVEILPYSNEMNEFTFHVLKEALVPNMTYNEEATEQRRQEAREEVEPVTIMEGEVIVREGERLTDRHLMILEDLGLKRAHGDYFMLVGLSILILAILALIGMYLYFYQKEVFFSNNKLSLLGLIIVGTLLIARILIPFSGYLIPTAMAAILITVLFGSRFAMIIIAVMSLLIGIMADNDINIAILSMVSGFVGTYSVAKLQQRGDLTRSGLYVAGANALVIVALLLIEEGFQVDPDVVINILIKVFYGILNGFLSAILAIGFLPFLESGFGLTTSVKLLELANPNHPLLKKLLLEAPGTYHHSVIVANLAETAADEVGANSILSRVGAYYHDIGKVARPYFFIENQVAKDNPHDKISPTLSSLIITSHIKDGVELAKKYKLPQAILDIIKEHHGTKLCSYFYQKACESQQKAEDIKEEDFRYAGPKPQSRESAIILLADAVEAAVRTISSPNPGKIKGLVRKLVKQHLSEGQLDECDLTLRDLNKISDSFVQVLSGIFHSRVEYPENFPERSTVNGTTNQQSNSNDPQGRTEKDVNQDCGNNASKGEERNS